MIRQFMADMRMAVRTLLKQPRFAAVASLTVALGVGAVTVIFSVVNAVLIQPLPYPNASRLVNIWSTSPGLGYDQFPLSPDLFLFFQKHQTAFEDMALRQRGRVNLLSGKEPHVVESALVTAPYFSTVSATFALGRPFTAEEDTHTAPRVAVISDRLWRETSAPIPASSRRPCVLTASRRRLSASRRHGWTEGARRTCGCPRDSTLTARPLGTSAGTESAG